MFMELVTSDLELLAALRAGALRNSELAYFIRLFYVKCRPRFETVGKVRLPTFGLNP